MELRSSRRRNEYKELQITLNGMGFYEEGMELQEMRQILDALQMSVNEGETNFLESDMKQAMRESELDFKPSKNGRVLNSTMMSALANISPCSSPEIPTERIVVEAEVHHPIDWSPPNADLPSKPLGATNMKEGNNNSPSVLDIASDSSETDTKRLDEMHHPINTHHESNNSVSNETEKCSTMNINNSLENSLQMSNSSEHEILGPVSVRRIHDSGFNTSNEIPHFSYNTTNENGNYSPNSTDNTENCEQDSNISSPLIVGPISVRRIHDSGVNTSETAQYPFNSNVPNNNFNNIENSAEISISSAANSNIFDDFEPST